MRRIAFINEKGGTCKTTLAVNVAAYFALKKKARVLLVDLDTQGHAGKSLGLDVRNLRPNVHHWLTDRTVAFEQVVHKTAVEGLDVVPSYKELGEFPLEVASDAKRDERLAERLASLESRYDFVVFDAPPSNGLVTRNIFRAATDVVVPVALTYLSLDGCAEVVSTVESMRERTPGLELAVSLIVPTLYRKTVLAEEILGRLRSYFPEQLAATPLGFNVKIDESQSHGRTIWEYAPRSKGAEMLAAIAEDLHARLRGSAAVARRPRSKAVA